MDIRSENLFRDGSNVKNSEPNLKTKVGQKGRHLYSKRGNYVQSGTRQQMCKCLTTSKAQIVLKELHEEVARGHFATNIIAKIILDVGYWWPTLFKDTHDFIGLIKPTRKLTRNNIFWQLHIATKWVEVKAFKTNTKVAATRFFYEYFLTKFGCPLTIVIDQAIHFIDDTLKHLTKQFLLKHVSYTTYYPQGNGQAKSINKVIGRLLTKLVNGK